MASNQDTLQIRACCRLDLCMQERRGLVTRRWHLRFSAPAVPLRQALVTSVQSSVAPMCPCGKRKGVQVHLLPLTPCSCPCAHSLVSGQDISQDHELIFQQHFWGELEEQLHRALCDQRTLLVPGRLPLTALPPATASTTTCRLPELLTRLSAPRGQADPPVPAHPSFPPVAPPGGPWLGVHGGWWDGPAVGYLG